MDCIKVFTFYLWYFFPHLTFKWDVGGVFLDPVSVFSSMAEQVLPWRGSMSCPHENNFYGYGERVQKNCTLRSLRYMYIQIHSGFWFLPWACLIVLLGKAEREHWQNKPPTTIHWPDRIVTHNKLLCFYRTILNFCLSLFIYILTPDSLFYWSVWCKCHRHRSLLSTPATATAAVATGPPVLPPPPPWSKSSSSMAEERDNSSTTTSGPTAAPMWKCLQVQMTWTYFTSLQQQGNLEIHKLLVLKNCRTFFAIYISYCWMSCSTLFLGDGISR